MSTLYRIVNKTEWSGIHTVCGGQLRALPNSVKSENYRCLGCGKNVNSRESIIFKSDSKNLENSRNPADVLQLSREERRQLSNCKSDEEIKIKVEELLSEKTIF